MEDLDQIKKETREDICDNEFAEIYIRESISYKIFKFIK